jgi:elongation factor Tu
MVHIIARIKLYEGGRKTPFANGYRPLFDFIQGRKSSGQITILDKQLFFPKDEGIVQIDFLNRDLLGPNFSVGAKFTFGEGGAPLGEGHVVQIL